MATNIRRRSYPRSCTTNLRSQPTIRIRL